MAAQVQEEYSVSKLEKWRNEMKKKTGTSDDKVKENDWLSEENTKTSDNKSNKNYKHSTESTIRPTSQVDKDEVKIVAKPSDALTIYEVTKADHKAPQHRHQAPQHQQHQAPQHQRHQAPQHKKHQGQEPPNKKSLHPSAVPGFVPKRPCKYFDKGTCFAGEECTFLHPGKQTPAGEPLILRNRQTSNLKEKAEKPETYPCYVRIIEGPENDEVIELPTEADGKLLLTTITAQFQDAIGLRFKSESGAWRGMRFIEGALEPPIEGWGYNDYFITKDAVSAVREPPNKKSFHPSVVPFFGLKRPCKYFEKGGCIHGEACTFLHPGVHTTGGNKYQIVKIQGTTPTVLPSHPPNQPPNVINPTLSIPAHRFPPPNEPIKRSRPCSFYNEHGYCRKGDQCDFLHSSGVPPPPTGEPPNKKSIHPSAAPGFVPKRPCKYFEKGSCFAGEECTFLHPGMPTPAGVIPAVTEGRNFDGRMNNSSGGLGNGHFNIQLPPTNNQLPPTPAVPQQQQVDCKWFMFTGMCKEAKYNQCTYNHPQAINGTTLVIKNLFYHPDLRGGMLDKETRYDVKTLLNAYDVFYEALLGKLSEIGKVVMFKCSCNVATYLQGTVFVQYATHESALKALATFNGKMFGEKVMNMELVPVTNWRSAVCCKTFTSKEIHDEEECYFIHAFPNPNNAFPLSEGICFNFGTYGWCDSEAGCQRLYHHPISPDSPLVIIPNYFHHQYFNATAASAVQDIRDEAELLLDMRLFYFKIYTDCISLFRTWGTVVSCVCAMNPQPSLRGNMYVEYATHQEACNAVTILESLQTKANICPKTAFQKCQLFEDGSCTRLDNCTKLHLLENPVEKPVGVVDSPGVETSITRENNVINRLRQGQESIDKTFDKNMQPGPAFDNSRVNTRVASSSFSKFPVEHELVRRQGKEDNINLSQNLESLHDLARGTRIPGQTPSVLKTPVSRDRSKSRTPARREDDLQKNEEDRNEYFVHITELPRRHDKSDIYDLFTGYKGIKDVDIPEPESPHQKEFSAFIIFSNRSMAERVLRVEHLVDGKQLRLEGFHPSGGRSPSPDRSQSRSKPRRKSSPYSTTTRSRSPPCQVGSDSSIKSSIPRSQAKQSPPLKRRSRSRSPKSFRSHSPISRGTAPIRSLARRTR